MNTKARFIQITATNGAVYALDEAGAVWKYVPANTDKPREELKPGEHYSFWSKLTEQRAGK